MEEKFEISIDEDLDYLSENELEHLEAEFENYEQLYSHKTTSHSNPPLLY
jgi:hypothetical protein